MVAEFFYPWIPKYAALVFLCIASGIAGAIYLTGGELQVGSLLLVLCIGAGIWAAREGMKRKEESV